MGWNVGHGMCALFKDVGGVGFHVINNDEIIILYFFLILFSFSKILNSLNSYSKIIFHSANANPH